ncbi:thioredoxin-like protein [Massariosphaeria phaeospora]|uniref:Thioredoxin-like protein n=1 Tax=Massariosphaeria phaeospora TaxID=100035 RepID=A0A7C8IH44_9PLEO|nr:thioredoxin-like protein [Massariosphaeria phaeospora]
MRSLLYLLLSLAPLVAAQVKTAEGTKDEWDEETVVVPDTIFNGQTVPPLKQLEGPHLDEDISHGNWFVEFYSPQCGHCRRFAPTWQTLYEFYYTSKTVATKQETDEDSLNSFTRWYDFKFAKVDCIAYMDACKDHNINNFPTVVQFKDGKEVKNVIGEQTLPDLVKWVEEVLDSIRPGSRPQGGPKIPKVGATRVGTGPETKDETKEKEAAKIPSDDPPASDATESSVIKSTPTPTEVTKAEPVKATSTANPSGIVEPLTAEKFQTLVTNTLDPWFVKFYAPWCHHCQAMAPNWSQMAREMRGKLNVGEVNCDVEKRLCKEAHVKGYPTILFFRGGERVEYNGLRGLGDFLDYAQKVAEIGAGVQDIDLAAFKKMEETEEVIFVYFYDHATTTEDFQALERLTLSLVGQAKLVKTNDSKMSEQFKITTWPRLMVSRDGKPSYYPPIAPKDMRDPKQVLNWMQSVWLPIVPELKSSNAREIMDGKLVVLAVLNRDRSDDFIRGKQELKNAALEWIEKQEKLFQLERQELRDAKQLRIEEAEDRDDQRALRAAKGIRIDMDNIERKSVGFAWVDGVFWERWIRTTYGIDVKDGEKVIINDEGNRRYWDLTITGEPIRPSRTSILETIGKVITSPPKITPKSTTGSFTGFFLSIGDFYTGHPWLALGGAIGFILAASLFGRSRMRRRTFGNTGSFFQLDNKEGILGSNGLGKND